MKVIKAIKHFTALKQNRNFKNFSERVYKEVKRAARILGVGGGVGYDPELGEDRKKISKNNGGIDQYTSIMLTSYVYCSLNPIPQTQYLQGFEAMCSHNTYYTNTCKLITDPVYSVSFLILAATLSMSFLSASVTISAERFTSFVGICPAVSLKYS